MNRPILRREFLIGAGAAVATVPVLGRAGALTPASSAAAAPSPATKARVFVGCCAISYKKYLDAGSMTMEDFFSKAVDLGVHSVDVTTYFLKSTDPAYLTSLRHLAFKKGLSFSGAAIRTEMCQSDAAKRAEEVCKIQQWVDATQLLGASHLRVFGGELPDGASPTHGIEWVAETMKSACEYAAHRGITLGIEDHHGITARASAILEILHRVDSPYAGINLDISNFETKSDQEQYSDIEACVPYATHLHIRDLFSATRKPIDLERVWQLLVKGEYQGFASAEYENEEDPMTGVPKLIEKIKTLCRKYSSA